MTTLRRILTTVGLAIAATGLASADSIITQNLFFPSGSDVTSWTDTEALNQFNNLGGTLTLEYIQFQLTGSNTVAGAATDANPGSTGNDTYTFQGSTSMTFSDPADSGIFNPTTIKTQTFLNQGLGSVMTAGPIAGNVNTGPARYYVDPTLFGNCNTATAGCESSSQDNGLIDPLADYASYIGTGTINETVTASTFAAFAGASYNNSSGSGTSDLKLTVIYDYIVTPPAGTPEPTTMALMGGALVGLGLLGKRLRKS